MLKKHYLSLLIWLPLFSLAQGSFRVTGKVTDVSTKQPLQGASVFCQNTTIGTVTNEEGMFSLTLNNGGYDLVISFSGFETQSLRINNTMPETANLSVELAPKEKSLEEVAIIATNEVKNGWEKYGKFFWTIFLVKRPMRNNVSSKTRKYYIFSSAKSATGLK